MSDRTISCSVDDLAKAPGWWLTKPAEIRAFLESLQGVEVEEIGRTAGGRPLIAAAWGEREMLPGRTCNSLASAIAGGKAEAFYGEGERKRQTIVFIGAAHGTEIEGTVAALNFLNVIVMGKDLRGREHRAMAERARKLRFVLVPILNVDGRERALHVVHRINADPGYMDLICQGKRKGGETLKWPTGKLHHPMPLDKLEVLGTYYNDAGVNLVYDTAFGGDCPPETTASIRLCCRELADCVILSHTDNGSLVQPPSSYVPEHCRQRIDQIAAVVGMRCAREGFPKFRIPGSPHSYAGPQFYQTDALYHASGALPLLIEFPCGYQNNPDNHDTILDIGLAVLDEVCAFGECYRLRPKEPKVR